NTGLSQQTPASFIGDSHPAEVGSVDVRNAVMPRQPLVDEGVIRVQKIENTAVFPNKVAEEQIRLVPHGLAQIVVEVREGFEIRIDVLEIPQVQPLVGEIVDQCLRFRIGQ